MVKPVAIYADAGTSEVGIASLKKRVKQYFKQESHLLFANDIIAGKLPNYSALIVPGGADLPYCRKLNGQGNQAIRQFVIQGGYYLGICAGAYYACQEIDFIGAEYVVKGARELGFFDGLAQGCLPQWTNGRRFDESVHSKNAVTLHFATEKKQAQFYYHGGPAFYPSSTAQYRPIATYLDGQLAIVAGSVGKGGYLLSGVHFELEATAYQQYVIQPAAAHEKDQERQLAPLFQEDYGKIIWLEVMQAVRS